MKNFNLKRLVLSTAIIGASSLAFTATAEQAGGVNNYDAPQSEAQSVTLPNPADRNITNPNTEGYSSTDNRDATLNNSSTPGARDTVTQDSMSQEAITQDSMDRNDPLDSPDRAISGLSDQQVEVDETIHFEANSVTLTESAEQQLESVVEQIDKERPVALTVEIQGSTIEGDMTSSQSSSAATMNQDSSAGFPADERGVAGARIHPESGELGISANTTQPSDNAQALEAEHLDSAQLVSRYRAENVRQYLERQGVTVVQWEMEGGVTGAASGESMDTGFATSNQLGAMESSEDVQQVRIVIVGDVNPESLSAL